MKTRLRRFFGRQVQGIRKLGMALLLAFCLLLAFPAVSSAHAVLIRSDPAQNAVQRVPPGQIRLWFSEAVDPQLSTAQVVTPTDQQAGSQQARVPSGENSEVVVTLSSHLTPGVYVVMYRTVSTDDGHIESGLFSFTVTQPNGMLPAPTHSSVTTHTAMTASSTVSLLNFPTLVSLFMVTLVELGAIGWVGATIFQIFVLEPVIEEHSTQHQLHLQARNQLLDRVLPLAIGVAFLAQVGVLVGQGLALTQGNNATALTLAMLGKLVLNEHFGLWWLVRMILLVLMALLLFSGRFGHHSSRLLSWVSLFFGLIFLIALAMSSHAAALVSNRVPIAVLVDWFHLFAAALWIGGMLAMALSYLPVLSYHPLTARASSLMTVLPSYSPWAFVGVFLMAITGPLSATFQLTSWQQLLTTAYGNVLLVKVLLVIGMLLLSAYQILILRPRIRAASQKYAFVAARLENVRSVAASDQIKTHLAGQEKQREARLAQPTRYLLTILRIEPILGVVVLLCVGFMNVLGGTLIASPSVPLAHTLPHSTAQTTQPQTLTLDTFDQRLQVLFTMTPEHVGINHFHIHILDPHTGKTIVAVKVQLNTELQQRDMGVAVVPLLVDETGQFSGSTDLAVSGTWRIIVQIQTPDDPYHFHEAYTDVNLSS